MLSVAIQAGGESRRMGQDKALRPFLGQPLIERVLARVETIADEIFVVTNRPEDYRFLNRKMATDLLPGRGALGGLYTALSVAAHPAVAVIGCDMPFVNVRLLSRQCELLLTQDVDAVVPRTGFGFEPLHAVYCRTVCLSAIRFALDAGTWRVSSWLDAVRLRVLSMEEIRSFDPHQMAFCNVNTPEEFARAERWANENSAS
jgi:molybdenum cofactor guanylyltransferase